MGDKKEGEYNKRILPDRSGETTNGNKLHTKPNDNSNYLHRFRIIEAPDTPCGIGNPTVEHILFKCGILQEERERLIAAVAKTDIWPIKKRYTYQQAQHSIRKIYKNVGQNK